jgi:ketol-acid reductoisomerase
MAKIYHDEDADLGVLKGKTIAIIGYGSQGHAQAQNLQDSGLDVVAADVKGSKAWKRAEADGVRVTTASEAAKEADLIHTSKRETLSDSLTASTFTSHRSYPRRTSTSTWWRRRGPATWCGGPTSRG